MMPVTLTVNGRPVTAMVEPRRHLADFLREHCRLTGTHLGCEHGVCGACTVLIDGAPVRSCIAFTVACDGQEVRTIEGFENDALMARLREAFAQEHALQCGFCTPGMLITARDIVARLPRADEERIRIELAGNLCRCTGYQGIVAAVRSVARSEPQQALPLKPEHRPGAAPLRAFTPHAVGAQAPPPAQTPPATAAAPATRAGLNRFEESFLIHKPPAQVWAMFADIAAVAACLPGAAVTEHDARSAKGRMTVKLGPIAAAFGGSAVIERDDEAMRGIIRGAGSDARSGSRTRGEVHYRLTPENDGDTRVSVLVEYSLQGMLAQFSRTSLVQELGKRLVAEFAGNLNRHFRGADADVAAPISAPLKAGSLLWQVLRERLRKLIG